MPEDTIAAIATPAGRGAIAIVRMSGPQALDIASKVWSGAKLQSVKSHTSHLGYVYSENSDEPIDQSLATVFRGPATFTGEDIVEFGLHGSPLIARQLLEALLHAGARLAGPGEFSRRAVANGRMSLVSAEATADLIAASSRAAQRIAMTQMRGGVEMRLHKMQNDLLELASLLELELDFSEEDVEFASRSKLRELAQSVGSHLTALYNSYRTGHAIKDGIAVAIVGPTNAGKSSLLNALVDEERAIVSDIHGTTRDVVEDTMEIGDYLFRFMDTAGLRKTDDPIERIGIERSRKALSNARIVLLVIDSTCDQFPEQLLLDTEEALAPGAKLIVLLNKTDAANSLRELPVKTACADVISISAKSGAGIDELKALMVETIRNDEIQAGDVVLTSERHKDCISQALASIERVLASLPEVDNKPAKLPLSPDLIAQEVRNVISPLTELTGTALQTPALLQNIFANFCIGK